MRTSLIRTLNLMEQEAQVLPALDHGHWLKRWEDENTPWQRAVVDPVLEVVSCTATEALLWAQPVHVT